MQHLKFGTTSQFTELFSTRGTGAPSHAAFYRPSSADGYFVIGDYGQANLDPPRGVIVTVTEIDPDPGNPMLVPPRHYELIWSGTSFGIEGSFWQPIPPDNYVALGVVAQFSTNQPTLTSYRCLRFDQVKTGLLGARIWSYLNAVSVYQIQVTNAFLAQAGTNPPTGPVYMPKAL
jgi:VPS62-like protein